MSNPVMPIYPNRNPRYVAYNFNFGSKVRFSNILERLPIYFGLWPAVRGRGVLTQISGPVVRFSPELWFSETAQQREDRDNIGKEVFKICATCNKSDGSNASPKEID